MKDMKKDITIEERFRAYFDGNELPEIDLSGAKRAVTESKRKTGRGVFIKLASASACLILAVVLCIAILPSVLNFSGNYFEVDGANVQTVSYGALSDRYGDKVKPLSRFEWADNASGEYSVYSYEGEEVLLRADLSYLGGMTNVKATLYIDLTGGQYTPQEFADYRNLQYEDGAGYRYETEYENGEYLSRAYYKNGDTEYFAEVSSHNESALCLFMQLIA